jgi:ADP-heptose:LPS heptosyltransferase
MASRILIIKQGSFGDIIVASGAVQDICNYHRNDEITVLTGPAYRKIFERMPSVDHTLPDAREPRWRLDLVYRLYRRVGFDGFDMIYDLQKTSRTNFYHHWFVKRAAWSGRADGCSHPYDVPEFGAMSGQAEFALQLQAAGVPVKYTTEPNLSWFVEDVSGVLRNAGVTRPYVVLMPGASVRHAHRCWPHYAGLAEAIIAAGVDVVTVPGPAELELCKTMPGIALTGEGEYLDFFQLAGVLNGAAFAVGNDSGQTHLAAHLGVHGLAVYGPITRYMNNMKRRNFSCLARENIADIRVDEVMPYFEQAMAAATGSGSPDSVQ